MLLELNASVHLHGGYFGTVLQAASAVGNYSLVSMIIEKGADLNASGGLYGTALQAAAARGNLEIMKILLERGAEVNVSGGIFGSALQGAVHNGNLEGVHLLLNQGALLNSGGGIYGSALHAAMERPDVEIFQHLLRAGADVNHRGRNYGSWLNLNNKPDILRHHILYSWSPPSLYLEATSFSPENGPAIVWAAGHLEHDHVKLLLEMGADVNAASGPWESEVPVVFRVDQRHIAQGHRVYLNFELGMTALIWAGRNGKRDIIELLLKYQADLEACSSSGGTALLAGSKAGHE
jgi:ankyrin repeat protein